MRLRSLWLAVGAFLLIASNVSAAPAVWKNFKEMETSAKNTLPAILTALDTAIGTPDKKNIKAVTTEIQKITATYKAGTTDVSIGGGRKKKEDMSFFAPTLAKQTWVTNAKKMISEDIPDKVDELWEKIQKTENFAYDPITGDVKAEYTAFTALVTELEKLPEAFAIGGFNAKNKEIEKKLEDYKATVTPLKTLVKNVTTAANELKDKKIFAVDVDVVSGLAQTVLTEGEMLGNDDKFKNDYANTKTLLAITKLEVLQKTVRANTINEIFRGTLPKDETKLKNEVNTTATEILSKEITKAIVGNDEALTEVLKANGGTKDNLVAAKAILLAKSKDKEPYTLAKLFLKTPKIVEVSKGGLNEEKLKETLKNTFGIDDKKIENITKLIEAQGLKVADLEKVKTELGTKVEELKKEGDILKELLAETPATELMFKFKKCATIKDLLDLKITKIEAVKITTNKEIIVEKDSGTAFSTLLAKKFANLVLDNKTTDAQTFDHIKIFSKFDNTKITYKIDKEYIIEFVSQADVKIVSKAFAEKLAKLLNPAGQNDLAFSTVFTPKDIAAAFAMFKSFNDKTITYDDGGDKTIQYAENTDCAAVSKAFAEQIAVITKDLIAPGEGNSATTMVKFTKFENGAKKVTFGTKITEFADGAHEMLIEKGFSDAIADTLNDPTAALANNFKNAAKFTLAVNKITHNNNKEIAFDKETTPKKISADLATQVANLVDAGNLVYEELVKFDLETKNTVSYATDKLIHAYLDNNDFIAVAGKVKEKLNAAAATKLTNLVNSKTKLDDIMAGFAGYKYIAGENDFNAAYDIKTVASLNDNAIKVLVGVSNDDYSKCSIKIGNEANAVIFRGKKAELEANNNNMPFKIIKDRLTAISTAYLAAYANDKEIRTKVDGKQENDIPAVVNIPNLDDSIKNLLTENRAKVVKLALANAKLEEVTTKINLQEYKDVTTKVNEKASFKNAVDALTNAIKDFKDELVKEVIGNTTAMDNAVAAKFNDLYNAVVEAAKKEEEEDKKKKEEQEAELKKQKEEEEKIKKQKEEEEKIKKQKEEEEEKIKKQKEEEEEKIKKQKEKEEEAEAEEQEGEEQEQVEGIKKIEMPED